MAQHEKVMVGSARTQKSDVDIRLGQQIRKLRIMRGYSQDMIAKSIGVTFQQLQKYERGINRVCVSRLIDICKFFSVQPSYIIDMLSDPDAMALNESKEGFFYNPETGDTDNKEILSLIRAYKSILNPAVRKKAISLIRVLSGGDDDIK